jgi:hypothetical protein
MSAGEQVLTFQRIVVPSSGCSGQKSVHHLTLQLFETSVNIYQLTLYNILEDLDLVEPSLETLAENEGHVIAEICWTTQKHVHYVLMAIILVKHCSMTRDSRTLFYQRSVHMSYLCLV